MDADQRRNESQRLVRDTLDEPTAPRLVGVDGRVKKQSKLKR
jgi:hypothetical protein